MLLRGGSCFCKYKIIQKVSVSQGHQKQNSNPKDATKMEATFIQSRLKLLFGQQSHSTQELSRATPVGSWHCVTLIQTRCFRSRLQSVQLYANTTCFHKIHWGFLGYKPMALNPISTDSLGSWMPYPYFCKCGPQATAQISLYLQRNDPYIYFMMQ